MTDFLSRLRTATADAHRRLEADLDLLAQPLRRERFVRFIERMYGFHAVWEPALAASLPAPLLAGRRKLGHLRADLLLLGRSPTAVDGLPLCHVAGTLAATRDAAFGSFYVLEGSTLGGQIMTGALAGADWVPRPGLSYLDPYGAQTGPMWRSVRHALREDVAPGREPAVVAAAIATFDMLHAWLVPVARA